MTTDELTHSRIPPALTAKLAGLLRRYRRTILVKGLSAGLTVFLVGMLVVVGLDRFFLMHRLLRTGLSVLVWLAALVVLWKFLLRPLTRIPELSALAASVEADHPELNEEVSSSVELLNSNERPEFRASQELVDAVVRRAERDASGVDFASVVRTERARKYALAAVMLLLVLAGLWALWWTDFNQLLVRFMAPWANLPRVSSTVLAVSPGDRVIARGDSQLITAVVTSGRASTCLLHIRTPGGDWTHFRMIEQEKGRFSHRLTSLVADVEYTLRARDALTRTYRLSVVDRPAVQSIDVVYRYPPYTGLADRSEENIDGNLEAVLGSVATVTFHTNKPLAQGEIDLVKSMPRATDSADPAVRDRRSRSLDAVGPLQYQTRIAIDADGTYELSLRDEHGFANERETAVHLITAVPDRAPVVRITEPYRSLRLPRPVPVEVGVHARDDFAVAKAELVFSVNNRQSRRKELPLEDLGAAELRGLYPWMLVSLGLRGGDVVTYHVEATDNHPDAPNVGHSATHTIRVSYPDLIQEMLMRTKNLNRMRESLSKLIETLKQAEEVEEEMIKAADTEVPDRSFSRNRQRAIKRALDGAQRTARQLAKLLEQDPVFSVLKPPADDITDEHIPKAAAEVGKIDHGKKLAESRESIDKARVETVKALAKAESIQRQMEQIARLEEEQMKLADLSGKESKLADEADKLDDANQDMRAQLAEQQEELQKLLDQMMDAADRTAALAAKADELKRLAEAVADLTGRQEKLKNESEDALGKRLDEIAKRQEALNQNVAADKPALQPRLDRAKAGELPEQAMAQAARELDANRPREALKAQQQAKAALKARRQQLEQAAQPDAQDAEMADAARKVGEFADRQEQLRKELAQAIGEEAQDKAKPAEQNVREDKRLAVEQEDVRGDTEALARQVDEAAVDLAGADEKLGKAAGEVGKVLGQEATGQMARAAENLDQSRVRPATDRQQKALDALADATGKIDALRKAVEDAVAQGEQAPGGLPDLAFAMGQMKAARADLLAGYAGKQAGARMNNAAARLARAAARVLAQGMPAQSDDPSGRLGLDVMDAAKLKTLLKMDSVEWNRLSSELRHDLLEGYDEKYPAEYRKLIRRYFREISETGLVKSTPREGKE